MPSRWRVDISRAKTHPSSHHPAVTRAAMLMHRPRRILRDLLSSRLFWFGLALSLLCALLTTAQAHAQSGVVLPKFEVGMGASKSPKDVSVTLQILFMMTILSLAPSILIMMTAFTRIIIVFSILRSAMGTPQIPPNQVLIGLALFLTFFIMQPVFTKINNDALQPYFANKIPIAEALDKAERPLRGFMIRQTYRTDLTFFIQLSKAPPPNTEEDVNMMTLIPAFLTSELKTAFIIGFYIYLPFLVIDMVVASTLMSMGMMMLPPMVVSLPAKLMLFVLADGWTLLIGSIARGFR
jgi:flagellar biosynthetic protein FliP